MKLPAGYSEQIMVRPESKTVMYHADFHKGTDENNKDGPGREESWSFESDHTILSVPLLVYLYWASTAFHNEGETENTLKQVRTCKNIMAVISKY